MERKLGRSGYQVSYDGGQCKLTLHTESIYVTLFMSVEEAEQLVDDIKEEFFGDRRHSN